ncbi:hypothetical protein ACQJ0M_05835 [Peribacillus simplex]|uniref:Uncharacterized protein n=1 Tax=Peribacillus simplex TaxID=1478 RepID=A0A9W4PGW6_9BACI|nr:hypothetical protein SRABI133_02627 [Peribacillus simplex]
MFNAPTAVVLDTSGTGFRFGRIPIQAVRPKKNKGTAHMKKEYWKPAAAHGFPSYMYIAYQKGLFHSYFLYESKRPFCIPSN